MEKYEARKQSRIVGDGLPEEMMDAESFAEKEWIPVKSWKLICDY